ITVLQLTKTEYEQMQSDEAFAKVEQTFQLLSSAAGNFLQALLDGQMQQALSIPKDMLRTTIAAMYFYNMVGANLHWAGAFSRAVDAGRITGK
ncbi:hypothetical protein, partial [Klebsiella pneumoniae]|uniref:hypothetical protein n=1 Tax=Klebsiella pneumoniae TaxID=573 RepID=UPI0025A06A15